MLTIVISALNEAATIGGMLDSLARQRSSVAWEVVLADNGSRDETVEIAGSYRSRLPDLRVVDASAVRGVSYARNRGVDAAAGELIAFLDADDEVAEGWVAAMTAALSRHELVAARLDFDRLNPAWARATRSGHQAHGTLDWWLGEYHPFAYGCTIGLHRRLHEEIGGFDESVVPAGEDMDYCWRLQAAGHTLSFAPDALVHYRLRSSLRGIFRQARAYGECLPLLYRKHRPLGMSPVAHPVRRGLHRWARALRHLVLVGRRDRAARLAWDVGERIGILRGAIRQRVLLL